MAAATGITAGPPPKVAAAIARRYGRRGRAWLDALPALVDFCADGWGLALDGQLEGGQMSALMAAAAPDGRPVVLKCLPDLELARREAVALGAWRGVPGVVQLLDAKLEEGVLLLERIVPGSTFAPADGGAEAAAALIERVHGCAADAPTGVPTLSEQIGGQMAKASARLDSVGVMPRRALDDLVLLAADLADPMRPTTLLHGDMQPRNILSGPGGSPILIDPRPSIGDPAFDAATWALKQLPVEAAWARAERIRGLLGLDADRVGGWMRVLAAETAISRSHHGFCTRDEADRLVAIALG
ncbi:MAG: aminoglycoside phosphotransferase family protein [Thermoleophilaceae bacterium]